MAEVQQSEAAQARALRALRPLMLLLGLPATAVFVGIELQQGRGSPWLVAMVIGAGLAAASLVDRRRLDRRAPLFVVGFVAFTAVAFLHFGSQIGSGLLFAAATLCAGFFLRPRAAVVTYALLTGVVAVAVFGMRAGWLPTGASVVVDSATGVRMVVTTAVALAILLVVFLRIQKTVQIAQAREIDARAEQQLAAREREQALELAMQAQRLEAVGRLASGVAHDFNNTLMVLQGTIELLGMTHDPEARAQLIDEGLAAVDSASATARQLLDLGRPADISGDGRCEPGPLIERFTRSMRRVLPDTLRFDVEIARCPAIPLPRALLEQVLLNLVINARDATDGHGVVRLRCRGEPGEVAVIEVSDTGAGMSEDTRRRLFEPFFTTKDPQHGTGLGLSMVHGLVSRSGGTIEVRSELGHGATFVLRWPPAASPQPAVVEPGPTASASEAASILVIEHNADVARVMARTLSNAGYTVTTVHDVRAARDQLGSRRFALVCTDVLLPDGTALDVVAAQRAHGVEIPLLVCTGYLERPELAALVQSGARLLRKPFALAHLVKHAQAAIAGASAPAPIDPPGRQG